MNIAESVTRLTKFREGYNRIAADALRVALEGVVTRAQTHYFRNGARRSPSYIVNRTGRLSASFERSVTFSGNQIKGIIRNRTPYARYVFEGTSAHWIPKKPMPKGKWLRWVNEDGSVSFAKQVWHPGTDPRPVITWAAKDSFKASTNLIAQALADEWRRRVG